MLQQMFKAHIQLQLKQKKNNDPNVLEKKPSWMIDYKVSDLDDSITHFTLLSYCDPVAFEDVVKESKWRLWMLKLQLLKKNNTWS